MRAAIDVRRHARAPARHAPRLQHRGVAGRRDLGVVHLLGRIHAVRRQRRGQAPVREPALGAPRAMGCSWEVKQAAEMECGLLSVVHKIWMDGFSRVCQKSIMYVGPRFSAGPLRTSSVANLATP